MRYHRPSVRWGMIVGIVQSRMGEDPVTRDYTKMEPSLRRRLRELIQGLPVDFVVYVLGSDGFPSDRALLEALIREVL